MRNRVESGPKPKMGSNGASQKPTRGLTHCRRSASRQNANYGRSKTGHHFARRADTPPPAWKHPDGKSATPHARRRRFPTTDPVIIGSCLRKTARLVRREMSRLRAMAACLKGNVNVVGSNAAPRIGANYLTQKRRKLGTTLPILTAMKPHRQSCPPATRVAEGQLLTSLTGVRSD